MFCQDLTERNCLDHARVVRKVDSAIHRINRYSLIAAVCFVNMYPLGSDFSVDSVINLWNNWGQYQNLRLKRKRPLPKLVSLVLIICINIRLKQTEKAYHLFAQYNFTKLFNFIDSLSGLISMLSSGSLCCPYQPTGALKLGLLNYCQTSFNNTEAKGTNTYCPYSALYKCVYDRDLERNFY